ncbi:MAG: ADP-forming succinate--CoA ligase subunit beta [Anaerolinea sp.]|nr:ADP-forming succinate--CoA ligase subunit beta [Anaerolinea sp.]
MKLHEYQSKQILSRYGIQIPRGRVALTANEAKQISEELGTDVIIKSQVLIGGRGKAGGIRLAKNPREAEDLATSILSMDIKGLPVRKVLVDEAINFSREIYLAIANNRITATPSIIASASGGMNIEEVAQSSPEKIIAEDIHPLLGLRDYQIRDLASSIDLPHSFWKQFMQISRALWQLFRDQDASLAEINPLVISSDNELLALDAKITIDDNALFRHPELNELRDPDAEDPTETEARKYGLSYIKLDGKIGCLVNGAGLAMAIMDMIEYYGGQPANFLDIGGGASSEKVAAAMRIILNDPSVNCILINIFGGITRCDEVARGVTQVLAEMDHPVSIIARLVGTNAQAGKDTLQHEDIHSVETLTEAAKKAVEISAGRTA